MPPSIQAAVNAAVHRGNKTGTVGLFDAIDYSTRFHGSFHPPQLLKVPDDLYQLLQRRGHQSGYKFQ